MSVKKEKHISDAEQKQLSDKRKIARRIRSLHPLGMRVVVKIRPDTNITESGLYLPDGAKESKQESLLGEVLEVAMASGESESDDDTNISGIPEGALVLIESTAGFCVPWDEQLRVVETKDVLALVEEVDLN